MSALLHEARACPRHCSHPEGTAPAHLKELLQLCHNIGEQGPLRGLECQRSPAERSKLWGHPLWDSQRLLLQGDLADDLQNRAELSVPRCRKQQLTALCSGLASPADRLSILSH